MKKKCKRCSASLEEANLIQVSEEVKGYIIDCFDGNLCSTCTKEINESFYYFGINPKYKHLLKKA